MKKKSALTAMVAVLVILAMALPLRLTAARAEESYVLHGFTIAERDGKFGILDESGRIVLPFDYYIPLDQFAPGEAPWCVDVYQYMEEEYTGVYDLTRDLETGRMKAGYFHLGSGYFSGCVWSHDVIAMDDCAAVCDDEGRWALLQSETGETVLDYQYDFLWPQVWEGWVYVWLWPTEYDERISDWVREAAYVRLRDGRVARAPKGFHFSEEAEPVENGRTRLYDDMFGRESFVSVDALLDETQP